MGVVCYETIGLLDFYGNSFLKMGLVRLAILGVV